MPRTTTGRNRDEERIVAARITAERTRRDWTITDVAAAMADAGCPLPASAIYKIEKGDPPRRITLNEFLAFAAIFEMEPADLLRPPTPPDPARLAELVEALREKSAEVASVVDAWCSVHEELYDLVGVDPATWGDLQADLEKVRSRVTPVVNNLATSIQYQVRGRQSSRGQHSEAP